MSVSEASEGIPKRLRTAIYKMHAPVPQGESPGQTHPEGQPLEPTPPSYVCLPNTNSGLSCFSAYTQAPPPYDITPDIFWEAQEIFEDRWLDARMWEVVKYLRGGVGLQLSEAWRESMPLKASSKSSKRSGHV